MRIHGGTKKNIGHDFSVSVNPLGMPKGCREAIVRAIDDMSGYPKTDNAVLLERISKQNGNAHVLPGNGSAELIYAICHYMSNKYPGFEAVMIAPTFMEYEYAVRAAGGRLIVVKTEAASDFAVTNDTISEIENGILCKLNKNSAKLVFLCNPNNPTGVLTARSLVERLAGSCQKAGAILVVDECFMRFVEGNETYTMTAVLDEFPNLIVLDAFTKFYAMAGLRIGYAVSSNDELLESIREQMQPWNVSVPAQEAAICALEDDTKYEEETRKLVSEEREFLTEELNSCGFKIIGSPAANFIMFKAPDGIREYLNDFSIDIRDCSDMMKYHEPVNGDRGMRYYRISVMKHEDNCRLTDQIRKMMKGI